MSNTPDSATGLTGHEKDLVRSSWAIVQKDVKVHAGPIVARFLQENPTYQVHFKSIADVPLNELATNKKVIAHGCSVLFALAAVVDNLEDPEVLVELLAKNSVSHFGRGIAIVQYENLGKSICGYLQTALGKDIMTDETTKAWIKTYGVIVSVISQGFDKQAAAAAAK